MAKDEKSAKRRGPAGSRRRGGAGAAAVRGGYHHGDLRAALIAAGEAELTENGPDGFTLRGCARRAGVSHAAPAHHFKDVRALLTVLATIGFQRLADTTEAFGRTAPLGTLEHFVAIGRGYVAFAIDNPAYFGLIFRKDSVVPDDPGYVTAADAAFAVPVAAVGAYFGSADPMADPKLAALVVGLWSTVHGFASLLLSGHLAKGAPELTAAALVERLLPAVVTRYVAGDGGERGAAESKSRRASRRHSHSR